MMRPDPFPLARKSRRFAARFGIGQRLVAGLLVLALLLAGMVPQGMMRVADATGQRLVLCTPDGPREIWMASDGAVRESAPLPAQNGETGKCLAVTLALVAVQPDLGALARPVTFETFHPPLGTQTAPAAPLRHGAQPRAPPVLHRLS